MADKAKKRRTVKPVETVRTKASKSVDAKKPTRLRLFKRKTSEKGARKEYHLPLPDNKAGRLLNKRVHFVPSYFKEAWRELRQVTWPSRKETVKLSLAVFVFALFFGGLIWLVDYGLDQLFKKVLI